VSGKTLSALLKVFMQNTANKQDKEPWKFNGFPVVFEILFTFIQALSALSSTSIVSRNEMSEQNQKQIESILDGLTNSIVKVTGLIGVVIAAVTAVIQYIDSKEPHEIAIGAGIVFIVAFVTIRSYRRQQQTEREKQIMDISDAAFRGLLPYEEGDAGTFFGRETDIGELLKIICYSEFRFGVLTGESGCGKTSLLRAGLIPKLLEKNYLPVYLRLYGDPELQIRQAVARQTDISIAEGETLSAYLQRINQKKSQTLVLCCDQFEEFFINHPDAASRQTLIDFVARCYKDQTLDIKFLFSLREDFLAKISQFDGFIPDPLAFEKRYHLHNFNSSQAEMIIRRSVDDAGIPFESGLCKLVAEDINEKGRVLPTELQIVCQQLQRQRIYSVEQYQDSGGKESLVYTFLEDVIKGAGNERDVKLVLRSMISEEDTKLALTVEQIARNSQKNESQVKTILHHFVNAWLIREIQDQTPWHYELMHEYLIGKINAISGSVMDAAKRANHIFKQWLARYQRDKKTLIPLADCHFIRRYSDLERNGTAGELLARSLHWGWLKVGVITVAGLAAIAVAGWYYWQEIDRRDRNMGMLVINNPIGAELKLERIRHYHKKNEKQEKINLDDNEIYLEGPADYKLTAKIKDTKSAYPVFIEGFGKSLTVKIEQPPKSDDIPEGMAYIAAGTFRMGDKVDKDGLDADAPAHLVFLNAYLIDKTEVSNQDFAKFIVAEGYENKTLWKDENDASQVGLEFLGNMEKPEQPRYWNDESFNKLDYPVVGVSWFEASAYCRWKHKQLPTEAQWEKAARGPEGYEWSFGNDWDETKANSRGKVDGHEKTAPVTSYQENSYGIYNMSGNVWEWVQDVYKKDFYGSTEGVVTNPVNDESEGLHVLRGGSWIYDPEDLRSSDRDRGYPGVGVNDFGFRCARTL